MGSEHRLTRSEDIEAVKGRGAAFRGRHCLLLVLAVGDQPTRLGVVASRRGVGEAVQRNRARRRLREVVRRRWPQLPHRGWWLLMVAYRSAPSAGHDELVADVLGLLGQAGVWRPEEMGQEKR
jgi:ribonuclease P protein component